MSELSLSPEKSTKGRDVIVFDGSCAFCSGQVEKIRRLDRGGRFGYAMWQEPGLLERFPALAKYEFNSGMGLVRGDGAALVGADAVHEVYRRLPGWRFLAWLYRVPGLRYCFRRMYQWVVVNRHRLPSRSGGACSMSTRAAPERKDR